MTDTDTTTIKRCSTCGMDKVAGGPDSDYDQDNSVSSGYRARCKDCRRAAERASKGPRKQRSAEQRAERERLRKERALRSAATRNALLQLIQNHRSEFERLVQGEQVRSKVIGGDQSSSETWISLNRLMS